MFLQTTNPQQMSEAQLGAIKLPKLDSSTLLMLAIGAAAAWYLKKKILKRGQQP